MSPDQWLGIETHSGDLRVVAAFDGRRVEVWFRGDDVADLKWRSGSRSETPKPSPMR